MKRYEEVIKKIENYKIKSKKLTKTYYLSSDVVEIIDQIAKEHDVSTSEIVNESLKYCFDLK